MTLTFRIWAGAVTFIAAVALLGGLMFWNLQQASQLRSYRTRVAETLSLELDLARAARSGAPVSLMMLDADHFKRFNDTFGHDAGDAVLKQIGQLLTSQIRKGDIACRFGGEEFTVVLPGATTAEARRRAEAICEGAKALNLSYRGRTLGPVTLSVGIATFPEHGRSGDEITAAADAALYRAKQAGRDRVIVAAGGEAPPPDASVAAA